MTSRAKPIADFALEAALICRAREGSIPVWTLLNILAVDSAVLGCSVLLKLATAAACECLFLDQTLPRTVSPI